MIKIDNLNFAKGRVWINENSISNYSCVKILTTSIQSFKNIDARRKNIALELTLPRNTSNYAFLGFHFEPSSKKHLEIQVHISNSDEELLNNNIAMRVDEVHLGIPEEYATVIINTARSFFDDLTTENICRLILQELS